jgi:mannose-1-phosphate guanylyltransferase
VFRLLERGKERSCRVKAFILAAGEGTRLRPLTESVPKCLLPVRGVPLLEIWFRNCMAARVDHVLVNAHAHAEAVKQFVTTQKTGVRVEIAEEPRLLGSAGTLAENRSFVAGEEAFFVLYGDVLTNADLMRMLTFHQHKRQAATLGICQVPDPTRCGIVEVDDNAVIQSFVEKPAQPASNWAFSGVMIAGQEVFTELPGHRPADIGFDLLPRLVRRMAAYQIVEYLIDIGTLENYHAAQKSWPGLQHAQHAGGGH